MKRLFSTRPFKNKLFLSYAVVGFCVVLIFGAFLIATTSRLNRETEVYHRQQLYAANLSELEQILARVDQLATQVISNNELLNFFVLLSSDLDEGNYFTDNLLDGIRAESILASINGTDAFAARISIYNQAGDFVATGPLYETPAKVAEILSGKQAILSTMELLGQSPSRRLILNPQPDRWSNNPKSNTFTVLRAFSPPYTAKVFAVLSIEMDANMFAEYDFLAAGEQGAEVGIGEHGVVGAHDGGRRGGFRRFGRHGGDGVCGRERGTRLLSFQHRLRLHRLCDAVERCEKEDDGDGQEFHMGSFGDFDCFENPSNPLPDLCRVRKSLPFNELV